MRSQRANSHAPESVGCLVCGRQTKCNLDNPRWLNQYSDTFVAYQALCSSTCEAELDAALYRMRLLQKINQKPLGAM